MDKPLFIGNNIPPPQGVEKRPKLMNLSCPTSCNGGVGTAWPYKRRRARSPSRHTFGAIRKQLRGGPGCTASTTSASSSRRLWRREDLASQASILSKLSRWQPAAHSSAFRFLIGCASHTGTAKTQQTK